MSFEGRLRSYFKRSRTSLAVLGLCSYSTSPGLIFFQISNQRCETNKEPLSYICLEGSVQFGLDIFVWIEFLDRISTRFCVGNIPDTFGYTFCVIQFVYTFCVYSYILWIQIFAT